MLIDAVTGSFGFTGRALTERLLADGHEVVTLSRRSGGNDPLRGRIRVEPFEPEAPGARDRLAASLDGVDTLYNTYWIRFPRHGLTYERAVAGSAVLLEAARQAGVRRVVHVSVVNAAVDFATPYVRAKAALEAIVRSSGLEWAIVRPTLTYGRDDILVNNLAWALRRLPVYGLPGLGRYTVQPVHVDDVARICVEAGGGEPGRTIDAAGPETLEYRELVELVRSAIGSRSLVVPLPAPVVLLAGRVIALFVRDVVLTRDELTELTSSFLTSAQPGLGTIRITDWVPAHADELGRRWSSELARNYRIAAG
ncbi:MAG TPA: NAD-dependent epimerase/dehydratase family protein [Candidatus Limnocylindrales bacterium]|nr:NAD-dependent epimerase/dehydratase family protein [Candidatus Limnocylindrales bacterium]